MCYGDFECFTLDISMQVERESVNILINMNSVIMRDNFIQSVYNLWLMSLLGMLQDGNFGHRSRTAATLDHILRRQDLRFERHRCTGTILSSIYAHRNC